ncbi:MAG: DHH family phosphoesterase [Candidatus ainarchaeum sp.]|nr:DHH family phosphoesterase [Candidatus ainarchaeum sp.]
MGELEGFVERCREAREAAEAMESPLVACHYDADGLSGGALVVKAFAGIGVRARSMALRKLSSDEIGLLEREGGDEIVFVDLGGGASKAIDARLLPGGRKIVIIDHHQTPGGKALQANPHLFGFDGGSELSSSGCGYFVFRKPELVELGVVGAVGDMQFPLSGLNRTMLSEGEKAGRVAVETDLSLFGRVSRPLVWFLQYCTEPFLPGLTGKRHACALFFEELGIPLRDARGEWRKYFQLSREEKVKVVSGLAAYLYSKDVDDETVRSLVGEVYSFPMQEQGTELSDAKEFSTVLNACGRHRKPEIGIGVCLGDEGAKREAKELLLLHRRQLREAVEFAGNAVEDFGAYYFLDGRGKIDDGLIGVVAGMLYGGAIRRDKPVIALSLNEEGKVKASARSTKKLVEEGINLGTVMARASEGIGVGGGHNVAAGANLEGDLNLFLVRCGKLIGESRKQEN